MITFLYDEGSKVSIMMYSVQLFNQHKKIGVFLIKKKLIYELL